MTTTDLLERLAAANPEPDAEREGAAASTEARLVLECALATPTAPAASRPRRRRARRWAAPVAAALAGSVAVTIALVSGVDDGRIQPQPATAAQVLERAARVAERRPPYLLPRADQFFYVHSRATDLSTSAVADGAERSFTVLQTHDRQIWTSTSRPGRLVERDVAQQFLTPVDEQRWIALGRPEIAGRSQLTGIRIDAQPEYFIGNARFTRAGMQALRPEPRELYERLLAGVVDKQGNSPNGEVFVQIGDALREQPAPPELRAALYRALAFVKGIELVGEVRDRLGRSGTAVAFVEPGTGIRRELIFDTASSIMLAERSVLTRRTEGLTAPAGTVIGDTVYISRGVVDSVRERPPAR